MLWNGTSLALVHGTGVYAGWMRVFTAEIVKCDADFEAYMIPVFDTEKGKLFRITLGNFQEKQDAERYASLILEKEISNYAQVIQLETK